LKHLRSVLLAAAMFLCTPAVFAQVYVGGSAGTTEANLNCAGTLGCNNDGTGGKLFAGYSFGNGLALEGVYQNFGEAKSTLDDAGTAVDVVLGATSVGFGLAIGGAASDDWSFIVRVGMARNKVKSRIGAAPGPSDGRQSTQVYSGASIGYRVTRKASIDLAFDGSRVETSTGAYNVRAVGLGVTLSF
jgi:OmpA-OmpF porin, OOP family